MRILSKQSELERTIIVPDTIHENVSLTIDNQKLSINFRYHDTVVSKPLYPKEVPYLR